MLKLEMRHEYNTSLLMQTASHQITSIGVHQFSSC